MKNEKGNNVECNSIPKEKFWENIRSYRGAVKSFSLMKNKITIQNPNVEKVRHWNEDLSIGGRVQSYFCANCQEKSKHFLIHADTDMVYQGIVGLYSKKHNELFITRLTEEEWHKKGIKLPEIEENIRKELFRDDMIIGSNSWKKCPKCYSVPDAIKSYSFKQFYDDGGNVFCIDRK